jgi:hypothetical protein
MTRNRNGSAFCSYRDAACRVLASSILSHHSCRFCAEGAYKVYTSVFPRCLTRKGYIALSVSFVAVGASLVTDETVVIELFELVCSRVFDLSSPFVAVRATLGSKAVLEEDLVTVVTAPIPFTDDFWTGSSLVLSRTRSCIGIGYRIR